MYLSKLDINGFKSFARGVRLEFQSGITAIVGPNGSGKSNVAEAIRWALGEQSLKAIRGKKSDDVIFAGSDKKARLGVAEVALHLNNEDGKVSIPYSEVNISRRVYRDGEGEYLVNNQQTRLQDIQLLLAQANFGQRTYSVIGQGMIDSFLLSSAAERKNLFDEAAGVRQYQLKKDQAVHKLVQAKENMAQGEAVMNEIEPRLRSLTRQVKRLERREEVAQELRAKQRLYYGLLWKQLQAELNEQAKQFSTSDGQRASIAAELETIQAELEKLEKERTANEVFADMQKRYNLVLDKKNRVVQEQSVIKGKLEVAFKEAGRGEVAYHQQRLEELKRLLDQSQEELGVTAQLIKRSGQTVERETAAMTAIDKEFAELETKLEKLGSSLASTVGSKEYQQQLAGWHKKYQKFVTQLHQAEAAHIPTLHNQATALEKELAAIIASLPSEPGSSAPSQFLQFQQELIALTKQRQELLERVNQAKSDLQRAEDQRQRLSEEQERRQVEFKKIQQESSIQELAKTNPEMAYAAYTKQAKEIDEQVADLDTQLKAVREEMNNFNTLETQKKDRLFVLQKAFRDTQHSLNHATNAVNTVRVEQAKLDQRQTDLRHEIIQAMAEAGLQLVEEAAKEKIDGDVTMLAEEIGHLNRQVQLIGGIDEQTTEEYSQTKERWEFLKNQADDLHSAIDSLEKAIAELDGTIKVRFDTAFKKINTAFNQYFRTLFSGGRAELVLIQEVPRVEMAEDDEDNEETEVAPAKPVKGEKIVTGIDIKATPPGKKLQSIAMLSGGEKALTSIALLCAIISNNPSPFVVLDEVDAALDEANSQRFAAILEHLAKTTQFITITHNRATMEKARVLYGVTMGDDGVSQLLSVKMEEAEEIIRKHGNR